jgi:hypothetical protein
MVERRGRARFLLEPAQPVLIVGKRRRQNLDGDFAIEPAVTGAVDLADPARAERLKDSIRADELANHGAHLFPGARFQLFEPVEQTS